MSAGLTPDRDIEALERSTRRALHAADSIAEPKLANSYSLTAIAGALLLLHDDFKQLRQLERKIAGS